MAIKTTAAIVTWVSQERVILRSIEKEFTNIRMPLQWLYEMHA
jgi:hypothetical protein